MSLRNIYRVALLTIVHQQPCLSSVRLYGRWSHRKPAKVLLPFEPTTKVSLKKEKVIDLSPEVSSKSPETKVNTLKYETVDNTASSNTKENENIDTTKHKLSIDISNKIKEKREEKSKKRKFYLSQKKVFDDNNEIIYDKLKDNDGRISSLLIKLKSKKERSRTGLVLVEGWRLVVDGLEAKCPLKYVIFSRVEDLNNLRPFLPKTGVMIYKIPYKEIELWSDVETSPGIFGVFETPTPENIRLFSTPLPLQIICDNIRIPGNLGAILRAAVGAGCEKILLTKGCVDLWDSKVVRSAAGAHFRLPIYSALDWEVITTLLEEDTSVLIADSNAKVLHDDVNETVENRFYGMKIPVLPYYSVEYSSLKHITLVIGGETEGISENSYRLAESRNGLRLNIPLQKGIDSLNTGMAAAVITFEIRKQLVQSGTKAKVVMQTGQAT